MTFIKGFNFRSTINGPGTAIVDALNCTYVLAAEVFPVTRNASTFGFSGANTGHVLCVDNQDNAFPSQLDGCTKSDDPNFPITFKVTLPVAGSYDIRAAVGDFNNPDALARLKVYDSDGTTLLYTIGPASLLISHWLDANGVDKYYNNSGGIGWVETNTPKRLTFTGTSAFFVVDTDGVNRSRLSHLMLAQIAGDTLGVTTPPAYAGHNTAFLQQPKVQLQSYDGVAFAQAGVTVTATLTSGTGALIGTATAVTDAAGLATFTNLGVSTVGTKTITFSATGTNSPTSTFDVDTATNPGQLSITTQPVGYTSESVLGTQPVIQIKDYTGANVAGSTLPVRATPLISNFLFTPDPIYTTHTIQAGTTASALLVSPAITFPVGIGAANYNGRGYYIRMMTSSDALHLPVGSLGIISSNTGTGQLNLVSPLVQAPAAGDTIRVMSGAMFSYWEVAAVAGVTTFAGLVLIGGYQDNLAFSATNLAGFALKPITSNNLTPTGSRVKGAELPRSTPSKVEPTWVVTKTVKASGGDYTTVQAAINGEVAAVSNTKIVIDPGLYTTKWTLTKRAPGVTTYIGLYQAVNPCATGTRVQPSMTFAVKTSVAGDLSVGCDTGDGTNYTHHYWIDGIEVIGNNAGTYLDIGEQTLVNQPDFIIFSRCYIHGTATLDSTRGLAMHGKTCVAVDCYISEIHSAGNGDTQAVAMGGGVGPHLVDNCYLESAGENSMIGGFDPMNIGLVTSDVTFNRCHFRKPLAWLGVWQSKNLCEMKTGRRVLYDACVFENGIGVSQYGAGIVLGSAMQSGGASYGGVRDVVMRNCAVRNTGYGAYLIGGINLGPAVMTQRIVLSNCAGVGINMSPYTDAPNPTNTCLIYGEGSIECYIDHCTIVTRQGNGTRALTWDLVPTRRTHLDNSIVTAEGAGAQGSGQIYGSGLATHFPDCPMERNLFIDLITAGRGYNASSSYPTLSAVGFADSSVIDGVRTKTWAQILAGLTINSGAYQTYALDGSAPGINATTLAAAISGVVVAGEGTLLAQDTPSGGLRWRRKFHHR